MPSWLAATMWGLVAGSALVLGAAAAWFLRVPRALVAAIMAFGAGVLISTLTFELMDEAYELGGFDSTAVGFLAGAVLYTIANAPLARMGAKNRMRSDERHPSEADIEGSGLAIALGALVDGVPEAIVIGLSLLEGGMVGTAVVVAIFLSNVPEGLSSAAGMKRAGRSPRYVFGVWLAVALLVGMGSLLGFTLFDGVSSEVVAAITALAAGAILSLLVDAMIPEAFAVTHALAGLVTVAGFLVAFGLSKLMI